MENINYEDFTKLDNEGKYITKMYSVARQFNHAIEDNEVDGTAIVNNIINKQTLKIFPYMVNKSFACEVYLKLIIKSNDFSYKFKKHNLIDLYEKAGIKSEFEEFIMRNTRMNTNFSYSLEEMYKAFETVSDAFVKWRYIYEEKDRSSQHGFLIVFSQYLELFCRYLIMTKYHVDMDKSYL